MNSKELLDSLRVTLKANHVAFIQGAPGVGKSDIVRQLASKYNLEVIDLRLSQCDITDLNGFPKISGDKASYLPMDTFPICTDTVPTGSNGWLLFLDELNSASKSVQAAAYKLILDRMVGQHKLHKKVFIIAAGNRAEDNAVVNDLSTALKSRMITLQLEPDVESWLDWANQNDIDFKVAAFIRFKGISGLHKFDPESTDTAYACPRSWKILSDLLKCIDETKLESFEDLFRGTVGTIAIEFLEFCKASKYLPKLEDVLAGRGSIPPTLGSKSIVVDFLVDKCKSITDNTQCSNACEYLKRFGSEYSVYFYQAAPKKNPKLLQFPAMQEAIKGFASWLRN